MHNYLKEIIFHKQKEVELLKEKIDSHPHDPINQILLGYSSLSIRKSLSFAILKHQIAIIAEIKRRSPSKNRLAEIKDPILLAEQYLQGGAAAISILTDNFGFGGCLDDLTQVANYLKTTEVVILRKDFILDEVQIAESIHAGADAVLLIVSVLQEKTRELLNACKRMNIEALVEVHTAEELKFALEINAKLIGINNRNLTTFEVDLNCCRELIQLIPNHVIKIAESGIDKPETAKELANLGFNGLLIGESLVKSHNPREFLDQINS